MIALQFIFLILVILPAPTSQQGAPPPPPPPLPLVYNKKSIIDWTKCGNFISSCFCEQAATQNELSDEKFPIAKPTDTTTEAQEVRCKIGVQTKFFHEDFALFQMQFIGGPYDLENNPQLMLRREKDDPPVSKQLFGCKFNSSSRKVELVGDPGVLTDFKINLFEDRSFFKSDIVLCAVTSNNAIGLTKSMKDINKYKGMMTVMQFLNVDYTHKDNSATFFSSAGTTCNPYSFNDLSESLSYHVMPIMNRDMDILNCGNYLSYTMRYDSKDETGIEMKQLECSKDSNDDFYYKLVKDLDGVDAEGNKMSAEVRIPESYNFYCAANIEEACKNPNSCDPASDPTCPVFTPGSKGQAAKLTCADNKWLINGEYLKLEANPVCKRYTRKSQNEGAFHFQLLSGKNDPQPGARCFKDYDCKATSKLFLPNCAGADELTCGTVDDSNGILKCKDHTKNMKVNSTEGEMRSWDMSSYVCNPTTGMYINGTDILPSRARVSCNGEPVPVQVAAAAISDGTIVLYIAGAFALFVIVILAVFLAIICTMKTAKKVRNQEKTKWMNMTSADRISDCKKDFAKVLSATEDNEMVILAGLDRIALMVEAETEEAECWEEACKFLKRFQGALLKTDHGLLELFSYYMYTLAKTIIVKHEWTTKERITKNNQKGLIRCAAIRLLSFAMYDPKCKEVQEFIFTGYNQLAFDAVEQYPHCGLMWSMIMHDRSGWFKHKARKDEQMQHFASKKFLETLKKIAEEANIVIPQDEIIPEFGSPVEQAAYAMGGSPNLCFHMKNAGKILTSLNNNDQGAVPRSYFRGMGDALPRISMQTFLESFCMWELNQKVLDKIWNVAPASMWADLALAAAKTQIDYGLDQDAQRLHSRLIFSRPVGELNDIEVERNRFFAAVEKVKDKLWDWFAKRTDKEELKKKPVYIVDPNLNLDMPVDSASTVQPKSKEHTDNKSFTPSSGGTTNAEQTPKPAASDPPPPAPDAGAAPAAPAAAPAAPQA